MYPSQEQCLPPYSLCNSWSSSTGNVFPIHYTAWILRLAIITSSDHWKPFRAKLFSLDDKVMRAEIWQWLQTLRSGYFAWEQMVCHCDKCLSCLWWWCVDIRSFSLCILPLDIYVEVINMSVTHPPKLLSEQSS